MFKVKTNNSLINVEVNKYLESIIRRKNEIPDRIESEGIRFLEKVNEGFKQIAKEKKWKVISASQNIKAISNQIKEPLLNNFPKNK